MRKIITIDQDACNGCGLCAAACHEGAIGMVNGKAQLLREDYCDGLGDCLPACPVGAISFEMREAPAYDAAAVRAAQAQQGQGCPGSRSRVIARASTADTSADPTAPSELRQWPVQIQLAPATASYLQGADVLVAADCTAYAYARFHADFIRGRVVWIGCPKLDAVSYADRLTEMLRENDVRSLLVARMEVPCCGGMEHAVRQAIAQSGKSIPWQVVVIATDGHIIRRDEV